MSQLQTPIHTFVPEFTLGDRLRRAREACGMTQAELAGTIGISQRSISNYEADVTVPNLLVIRTWASTTQVNLPWLAYGDAGAGDPGPGTWMSGRRRATRSLTTWEQSSCRMDRATGSALVTAA